MAVHENRNIARQDQIKSRVANFPAHHVQRIRPDMACKGAQFRPCPRPNDGDSAAIGKQSEGHHVLFIHTRMVIGKAAKFKAYKQNRLCRTRTVKVGCNPKADDPARTAIAEQGHTARVWRKAHRGNHPAWQARGHGPCGGYKNNLSDFSGFHTCPRKRLRSSRLKHLCCRIFIDPRAPCPASGVKIIFWRHGDMALRYAGVAQYLGHARRQGLPFRLRQNRKDISLRNAMRRHRSAERN